MNRNPRELNIGGWFLSFTEQEIEQVSEVLTDEGYEASPKGLREWILEEISGNPDEEIKAKRRETDQNIARQLGEFIVEHPEALNQAGKAVREMAGRFMRGYKKGGR